MPAPASTTHDSLAVLHRDRAFRERHEAMLPHVPHRQRGEFDPDRVLAEAKIIDAETLEEAIRWLSPQGTHDRAARPRPATSRDAAQAEGFRRRGRDLAGGRVTPPPRQRGRELTPRRSGG